MQITIALLVLLAIVPGLANSLDWFAHKLHITAIAIRDIQHKISRVMEEKWASELSPKANLEIVKHRDVIRS